MSFPRTTGEASAAVAMPATRPRPVILIVPDIEMPSQDPTENIYLVRANYSEAVAMAGGLPVVLPYEAGDFSRVLALADGILLTGAEPGSTVAARRRIFERQLVQRALEARLPLLGICHGMQLIGEYLGGQFVTSLPDAGIQHLPRAVPDGVAHDVVLEPGSTLADLAGKLRAEVNSLHRHALSGDGRYRVCARAADGVIEAFEADTESFCMGVQWHPEYRLTDLDTAIFRRFVECCADRTTGGPATEGGMAWRVSR